MARDITSGLSSNLTSQSIRPLLLVEMDFTSGISRINSTPTDVSWNSQTWFGIPNITHVGDIIDTIEVVSTKLVLTLNGVPSEQISNTFTDYQGRDCNLYVALFDTNMAIIADPKLAFPGEMESMVTKDTGRTCNITLTAVNKLAKLNQNKESLWTHEEQKRLYPGDMGLEFINELADDRTIL